MSQVDWLKLKASLLVEGINCESQALEGMGTLYKEQNHGLFGWDFENHTHQLLPDDFCLPEGTVVQFRLNSKAPYIVRKSEDRLVLFEGRQKICTVSWIKRPEFYDNVTASGHKMVQTGQIGGEDCLFFCYQNYCSHFSHHKECMFCNLVSASQTYDSVLKKKDTQEIGEVAQAAWQEGTVKHVLLTGGCMAGQKEVELVSDILSSIRRHTGMDRIPGTILPSPARGDDIKRYFDTGIQAIGFSMEIWDEQFYKAICPGKSETTSHEEFVASVRTACRTFGEGNVYVVLVMGLEPKDSFLEAIKVCSSEGANVVPFVWSANPGSRLEGHRAPTAQWYADVIRQAAEIYLKSSVPSGTENHCYKCDGNNLLHDALREKAVE